MSKVLAPPASFKNYWMGHTSQMKRLIYISVEQTNSKPTKPMKAFLRNQLSKQLYSHPLAPDLSLLFLQSSVKP